MELTPDMLRQIFKEEEEEKRAREDEKQALARERLALEREKIKLRREQLNQKKHQANAKEPEPVQSSNALYYFTILTMILGSLLPFLFLIFIMTNF